MTPRARTWAERFAAVAALVGIWFLGMQAVSLRPEDGQVASFWPSAGLAVGLLALSPRRRWPVLAPGIAVAVALANLSGGRELDLSIGFGLANAAEALTAGLLLRGRDDERPRLGTLDDFLRLVRACLVGAVVIATGGGLNVVAFTDGSFFDSWISVFASHGAATLVMVPVALAWDRATPPDRLLELGVQVVALVTVTILVFSPDQDLPLAFAPLPLLVWAALRFDMRAVTVELLLVSAFCTVLTADGLGPFGGAVSAGDSSVAFAGAMVQIWLLSSAVMSLPLTVVIEQRRHLMQAVSASEELFRRNFTESLTGMLLLHERGGALEVADANETARDIVGGTVVGRRLDDVLTGGEEVREELARVVSGRSTGWRGTTGLTDRSNAVVTVAVSLLADGDDPVWSAQVLDVTAEHAARRRTAEAEQLTQATLDTTAALILVTDTDGTIVRANRAASTLTGWSEQELVGRPLWERLVAPDRVPIVERIFRETGGLGLDATRETEVPRRDGRSLRILWSNDQVRGSDGQPEYAVLTGVDVTAERRALGMVRHLMQVSSNTVLVAIDEHGLISLVNSAAQRMLRRDAEDLVGKPFIGLLDPAETESRTGTKDPAELLGMLVAGTGAQGETPPRDWTCVSSDGVRHAMSLTLSVTTDVVSGGRGYLCVGQDVTEQRKTQEMLIAALEKERTAVERLRKLDAAKNEFVSTVSHELRTPITSIVGYTEMLEDGAVATPAPEQLPLLATIARNGERLIAICNDLLMLSGLDSGVAAWDRDRFDLRELLPHLEDSVRSLVHARRLSVTFDSGPDELPVLGDRTQLDRALLNLLSNAVKFTDDGGSVTCTLARVDDEAVATVRDTGIGIPAAEQDDLFTKFFRSSTAQQRAIPGTGLGLSIVAGIVSAHGGRISVESAHLDGTTFTVRLPLGR